MGDDEHASERAGAAGPPHAPGLRGHGAAPDEMMRLPAAVWPRGAYRGGDGVVRLGGVSVAELAERFGTPLFVMDEDDFRSRCRDMADAFGGAANVHYASKAFLSAEVARWVADEGLCLDVASGGELAVALRGGFPAGRITMHGNNKSVAELEAAVKAGVGCIVVDSMQEITRLDAVARGVGVRQDAMVRVTAGVEAHTHEFIATAHEDQKFGFSLTAGDAMTAAGEVIRAENVRLVGLHSHIGSQIFGAEGFELAAHRVIGLLEAIVAGFGSDAARDLDRVDLGGGFGISYTVADDPPPMAELAVRLRRIVEDEARSAGVRCPRLTVEPGRAIAGPGTVTLYEVGTVKSVMVEDARRRVYVSVDGGMSDNIRPALYGAQYEVRLVSRSSDKVGAVSRVVGKHCESGDVVVRDAWLPGDVAPGDLLGVPATGAYGYAMSSRYNMLTRPAVVALRGGQARLILRRETVEDLLSLEV